MSKLFTIALAIGIVIVANLFFNYAIALVYREPVLDAFCPMQPVTYNDAVSCVANGGQWSNYSLTPAEVTKSVQSNQPLGYCDANFTCQRAYNDAHSIYNRNVFVILVVLGIVSFVVGAIIGIEVLSIGFSWAGVLALVIASIRYWSDAGNLARVVILAVALGLLIWIGIKKSRSSGRIDKDGGDK